MDRLNKADLWSRLVGFLFAAGIFVIIWAIRELRTRKAQAWPMVDGHVESAEVREEGMGEDHREIPEISYSYRIDGEYYGGYHQLSRATDLELFPKGSRVVVHFKSSDPSKSFLDREDLRRRKNRMTI